MKRSEINAILLSAKTFMQQHQFYLPTFAQYRLEDWATLDLTHKQEIFQAHLGWDITDFGSSDFTKMGLTLFTLRNQSPQNHKPYAEKIMLVQENQLTPLHYHWQKMEDIINRGGGNLMIQLYQRDEKTDLLDKNTAVHVCVDGEQITLAAGGIVRLQPGQSICLPPTLYHCFWAEENTGTVLAGEVSMANDDLTDNRFLDPVGRFSHIEEDEQPIHLLCSDYQQYIKE
ncbi:D-lyxose/D-mannose family sugar isomerase [Lonepinella koalarum]|uniref:D-lyxose/D-mannose family sugar isomerase n=1 Tax=Lonepinella koalarum TaxID=53417 RepID=UPI003F6E3CC4